jgi:hypothetical protein
MPALTIHLSREVLDRLVDGKNDITLVLGVVDAQPRVSSESQPVAVRPRLPLAGLLRSGPPQPGERLIFSQPRARRQALATVQADGSLLVEGKPTPFWSPWNAAGAVTGSQINGWTLWRRERDGRTLAELRDERDGDEDS